MLTTVLAAFPSPSRGVWHLGPVPIRAYALCIIAGIIAALIVGDRRWAARGGERGVIYDIALWAVPFGLIGGRVYHLMTDWRTYFGPNGAGADAALRIWDGGLGIWGAIALGGVGAWIACRRRGIPLPAFADAIAPGIVLAQAIGRLGNYFNQELYGRETGVPWGLQVFFRRDPSGIVDVHSLDGVSTGQVALVVQPTFLYELLWNLLVFVVLIVVDRRFKFGHGRLFALYVAAYCVGRFGVELLRDDPATMIYGIRVNSFTSTFVFIGAVVYMMLAPKQREDPEALRATWATDESEETSAEPGADEGADTESGAAMFEADVVDESELAESDADEETLEDEAELDAEEPVAALVDEEAAEAESDVEDESEELSEDGEEPEPEPEVEDEEPLAEAVDEEAAEAESDIDDESEELFEDGEVADAEQDSEVAEEDSDGTSAEVSDDLEEPEPEVEDAEESVVEAADEEAAEAESDVEDEAEESSEADAEPEAEDVAEPVAETTDEEAAEEDSDAEPEDEDEEPSDVDEVDADEEPEVAAADPEESSAEAADEEAAEAESDDQEDVVDEAEEPEIVTEDDESEELPSAPETGVPQARTRWWNRARRNRR